MPQPAKPYLFRPSDGGRLFTNPSHEAVGAANYVVKRNWRRQDTDEQCREGRDYFWINRTGDYASHPGIQPFPNLATQITASSATWDGSLVTLTFASPHGFSVGEIIFLDGDAGEGYAGFHVVNTITRLTLTYDPNIDPPTRFAWSGLTWGVYIPIPVSASGTVSVRSAEPINLVTECRRPNGQTAFVVGTRTTLFRFFPNDGDPYISTDYWVDDYIDEANVGWEVIGRGFSVSGKRWEFDHSNGYLILNNGVDLPVTYRVEDFEVEPIYELREQGIASVGTMCVYNEVLCCFDVRQLKPEDFLEWMLPIGIDLFNGVTASQSGTTVTFSAFVATAGDVGKFIEYSDGSVSEITSFTAANEVEVVDSLTKSNLSFRFKTKGSQTGSYFSMTDSAKTATLADATKIMTMSAAPSTAGIAGDVVRFANGFQSAIASVTDTTHYVLEESPGEDLDAQVFWIIKPTAYTFVSGVAIFTSEMVGRKIYVEGGDVRTITGYTNSTTVTVDSDGPISSNFMTIEDPTTYGAVTDDSKIDRIQWRWIWGEIEEPRRWAASIGCTVAEGSPLVTLDYPALSLESGQQITILGAGVDGANLTGTIQQIFGNRFLSLDVDSELTGATTLQRSDSIGGLTGSQDLMADGTGVLKALPLQDTLVIYKDTAIFLANYTGTVGAPFAVRERRIPANTGLYFRNTLITVDENRHVYAGRRSFYQFDLTNQTPIVLPMAEGCRSVFFSGAQRSQTEDIYASDNAITKETWLCYPHGSSDFALVFDQLYGTPSTTDGRYGASGTVVYPSGDPVLGESNSIFVLAIGERLCIYGLTNFDVASWGGREYFWRRDQFPFVEDQFGYDAVLQSGLESFNNPDTEKDISDYVLFLSSHSEDTPLEVELLSSANPTNNPEVADKLAIEQPEEMNQMPTFLRDNFFADRVTLPVRGEKVAISGKQYRAQHIGSGSVRRAPGDF